MFCLMKWFRHQLHHMHYIHGEMHINCCSIDTSWCLNLGVQKKFLQTYFPKWQRVKTFASHSLAETRKELNDIAYIYIKEFSTNYSLKIFGYKYWKMTLASQRRCSSPLTYHPYPEKSGSLCIWVFGICVQREGTFRHQPGLRKKHSKVVRKDLFILLKQIFRCLVISIVDG
jgi:hypothetical protein